jgi:hypothetical protein
VPPRANPDRTLKFRQSGHLGEVRGGQANVKVVSNRNGGAGCIGSIDWA